jgi:hypothetical protein
MHRYLMTAACAAAFGVFACGSAMADPAPAASDAVVAQGTISADYTDLNVNHLSGNVNDWGGGASGVLPLGGDFAVQADGGYHELNARGGDIGQWNVGGALAWTPAMGRLGVNVTYTGFDVSHGGGNVDLTTYGAYGEWYAGDRLTADLKAGGARLSAGFGGVSGNGTLGYVGGQLVGYATPDFAVTGSVDWAGRSGINITTASLQAEYLVSHDMPLSVFGGYTYTDFSSITRANAFSIGLKYYFGGGGSLVQHQRTGVDSWGPAASAIRFLF